MSDPLFIYECPVCKSIHEVRPEAQLSYSECLSCGRRTVLVYEACYWKDNKPHLNPDIRIMYWKDYMKKVNAKKGK